MKALWVLALLLCRAAGQAPALAPAPLQEVGTGGADVTGIRGWASLGDIGSSSQGPCAAFALDSKAAFCWGRQLGDGGILLVNESQPVPVPVSGARAWRQLASGAYQNASAQVADAYSCGILATGAAGCWGSDFSGLGLLGSGTPRTSMAPLSLAEPGPWDQIAVGEGTACALKSDDSSLWCWGSNARGTLGSGLPASVLPYSAVPRRVNASQAWLSVSVGAVACAISNNASLWCWGPLVASANSSANGSSSSSSINGPALGENATANARPGANGGAAANATLPLFFTSPQLVEGLTDVAQVGVGGSRVCVVGGTTAPSCFDIGEWPPQLEEVPGTRVYQSVSVGADHQCLLSSKNQVLCWGANVYGQCGNGATDDLLYEPTPIRSPYSGVVFVQVEAGDRFTCARTNLGEIYCFGGWTPDTGPNQWRTHGELGNGSFWNSPTPVLVSASEPLPSPPPPSPQPSSPPSPAPSPPTPVGQSSTDVGVIVGSTLGGLAVLAAAAAVAALLLRRRRRGPPTGPELPVKLSPTPLDSSTLQTEDSGGKPGLKSPPLIHASSAKGMGSSSGGPSDDELLSWLASHPPGTPLGTAVGGMGFPYNSRGHMSAGGAPCGPPSDDNASDSLADGGGSGGSMYFGGGGVSRRSSGGTPLGGSGSYRGSALLSASGSRHGSGALLSGGSAADAGGQAAGEGGSAHNPASGPSSPQRPPLLGGGPPGSSSSARFAGSGRLLDIRPWVVSFSDLRIERAIGSGSFGKVYLATYRETQVAVKILMKLEAAGSDGELHPITLSNPALSGLYKEAEVMAAMRHPNIVQLVGLCAYPPAIITEYCSLGSLTDVLSEGRRDPARAAHLTWRLRLGMALDAAKGILALHAHSPPIIHRDLKSPNLLVDHSWRVKVTDFNLAKIIHLENSLASSQGPAQPRWLAPEILSGAKADAASDVFSFGICLWELLTWQVPWAGVDFWEIVRALLGGDRLPVPPREQLPGPDTQQFVGLDAYVALMQRCWQQEPADRPQLIDIIPELRRLQEMAP